MAAQQDQATLLKNYCRGKNAEQVKVIEYFCKQEGCLSKNMSDDEYSQMVIKKRDSLNLRQKALNKIGLDEDEVSEIPPAVFEGYVFKNAFAKKRANGNWVSSAYQVAWLFFSSTQIYVYRYTFNMDEDKKTESTDEFFYKDVTSFSTSSETETAHGLGDSKFEVETNKFKMVVPGDKIFVSMDGVSDSEAIIQAMKQKLREKKM
nr:MAG TPA: hypothetical protein [Caudoviricetes sp.]